MPKATEHIDNIIGFVQGLVEKGFAYASEGDVYFDVTKDSDYGRLSNRSVESMQGVGGSTVDRKRSAADFALWKKAKQGEPMWESPWGPGRPGWHIECSAMSRAILGEQFDIHGGGLDLVFPHHENEIAQSESLHGCCMARYWMHNGLMQAAGTTGKVGGRSAAQSLPEATLDAQAQAATKISKSTGAEPFKSSLNAIVQKQCEYLFFQPTTEAQFILERNRSGKVPVRWKLSSVSFRDTNDSLENRFMS